MLNPMQGKNTNTLSAKTYLTLHGEIPSGALKPGARLVRRSLAKRLRVSPLPVIEALLRLEQDGLVESEPMRGSRVRILSVESVMNDRVLREAIECQAARMASENATAEHIELLFAKAEILDELLPKNAGDLQALTAERKHLDFHVTLAKATGYESLAREMERVWFRHMMLLNTNQALIFPVPEHWHNQLVKAIAARDPDLAVAEMRRHVRYNTDKYRETLKDLIRQEDGQ